MAVTSRQRSVPPSMFSDEELLELPPEVRLTGIGLRFHADDHGRGSANPVLIKAQLWPLTPDVDHSAVEYHLLALEEAGYIRLYDVGGRTYYALAEWPRTDRAQQSRIPAPPDDAEDVTPVTPSSRGARETPAVVGGKEGEGEEGGQEGSVGGSGGSAVGGARRTLADLAGTPEPSPFCSRHPIGTEDKCGPCGGARKRHEVWVKAQVEEEELEVPAA